MDVPWEVVVLAAVLGLNRLVARVVVDRPVLYWGVQALNATLAGLVAVYGLPALSGFPAVSWLVSGLLLFHSVQNLAHRSQLRSAARRARAERERARELARLGSGEPPESSGP